MLPDVAPHRTPPILASLTPREREVLHWMCECKTNWEIGQIIGCSEATVKKHLSNVFRKLVVDNRMQAAWVYRSCLVSS